MTALPPRARLAHVLRALAKTLPSELGGLLDAPRFAEGKAALLAAGEPAASEAAVAAMTPEEAAWMADLLLERWEWIGDVALEPAAAIVAPDELWIGAEPVEIELTLATFGVDDDWDAMWDGAVIEGPPAQTARLLARPPQGEAAAVAHARARVRARAKGQRCLLVAEADVRLRRPRVTFGDDGLRLVVRDQTGQPGVGVTVEIGAERFVTGPGGLIELVTRHDPEAVLRVQGVGAGRVRGA